MKTEKDNMSLNASPEIFKRAQQLRAKMTEPEKLLWEKLKKNQLDVYKFRRQHPILKFILDFYCHKLKLGIELDGKHHYSKDQKFHDQDRTQILNGFGVKVIRLKNEEVFNDIDNVLEKIKLAIGVINQSN